MNSTVLSLNNLPGLAQYDIDLIKAAGQVSKDIVEPPSAPGANQHFDLDVSLTDTNPVVTLARDGVPPAGPPIGCEFYGLSLVFCAQSQPADITGLTLGVTGGNPGVIVASCLQNGPWGPSNFDGRPQQDSTDVATSRSACAGSTPGGRRARLLRRTRCRHRRREGERGRGVAVRRYRRPDWQGGRRPACPRSRIRVRPAPRQFSFIDRRRDGDEGKFLEASAALQESLKDVRFWGAKSCHLPSRFRAVAASQPFFQKLCPKTTSHLPPVAPCLARWPGGNPLGYARVSTAGQKVHLQTDARLIGRRVIRNVH